MRLFNGVIVLILGLTACNAVDAGGIWTIYPSAQNINDIAVEGKYIWCATNGGVVRWNKQDGTHRIITTNDGLADNYVLSVIVDRDGVKWFGTKNGVTKYDGASFTTFSHQYVFVQQHVTAIAVDSKGILWFGTDEGVSRFDGTSLITYTTDDGLVSNGIKAIIVDDNNVVWIGTSRGISSFDGEIWKTYTEKDGLSVDNVIALAAGPDGVIWAGTWGGGGLSSFDGKSWSNYDILHHTSSIDFDKDGLLWLGTNGKICSFDGSILTSFSESSEYETWDTYIVAVDTDGTKWIGSKSRCGRKIGLSSFDGQIWKHYPINSLLNNNVQAVAIDHDGVMWFGTYCGISSFDGVTWTSYTVGSGIEPYNLLPFTVYGIGVDHNNVKWFSTRWGVKRFDGYSWETYTENDSLSFDRFFHDISIDYDNVKWFATVNGVWSFDGLSWKRYAEEDGLVNKCVRSIAVDHDNIKWFGTEYGTSSFDGSNWITYTEENGLPTNKITSIAIDTNNRKWFGGSAIMSFDGSTWEEHKFGVGQESLCGGVEMAVDEKGVVWAVMRDFCTAGAAIHGGIASFDGSTWKTYQDNSSGWPGTAFDIDVEKNNVKWFATMYGVYSYDDMVTNAIEKTDKVPNVLIVNSNYPNPFNPSTTISYEIPDECHVKLVIYDILGREVAVLKDEVISAGVHNAVWDGKDEGVLVGSGVYLYKLKTGEHSTMGKMMLLR